MDHQFDLKEDRRNQKQKENLLPSHHRDLQPWPLLVSATPFDLSIHYQFLIKFFQITYSNYFYAKSLFEPISPTI